MPKLPKIKILLFVCNILRKKCMAKLIFCMQVSIKIYYKLILILLGMVKHFQSSQNSTFAMSLQCLKIEVGHKVNFLHADKHQSGLQVDFNTLSTKVSYKVILSLLMSMMKHSQSTQSIKFANLCNISIMLGVEFIFSCR